MIRSSSKLKKMIIATFGLLPFVAVSASAQEKAQVNVPFAFLADQVSLPAGHYKVLATDSHLTLINMENGRAQAMVLTMNEQGNAIEARGSMKFHVAANRYVLTEVLFAGSSEHKELLHQPMQEHITASLTPRRDDAIEIAMNR
jgi:hypothetical protein